jgi:hypothetical protein
MYEDTYVSLVTYLCVLVSAHRLLCIVLPTGIYDDMTVIHHYDGR